MASWVNRPQFPRPAVSLERDRLIQRGRVALTWRPPRGDDRRQIVFQIGWLPFWAWSDLQTPRLAERDAPLTPAGPAGQHVARAMDDLVRRIWFQRAFVVVGRAAWLPLLVGCFWLVIELAGGPALNIWALIWIGVALLICAIVFAWFLRPTRRQIALMLDRSFALQERMLTALENLGRTTPEEVQSPSVSYLQLADAANVINDLRTHSTFRLHLPVREVALGTVCALVLATLLFLRGIGGGLPGITVDAVPAFVPAADRLALPPEPAPVTSAALADAPSREDVQAMAERSNQTQQDLKILGDALSDQAATRAAAQAIQRGDYAEAADLLREVAGQADQISEPARQGLADDLDQAASQMSSSGGQLADSTRGASDGLRDGDEAAQEGMRELGDAVERAAGDIVSQQELASEMARAEAAESSESGGQPGDPTQGDVASSDQSASESMAAGDPSGTDASPGQTDGGTRSEGAAGDNQQAGGERASSEGQPGDPDSSAGQSQSNQAGQPGDGVQPGEASDGASQSSGEPGQAGQGGDPGAGSDSATGDPESSRGRQGSDGEGQSEGEPPEPEVTDAAVAEGRGNGSATDPRSAITLSRSPDASGVQTSSNAGAASAGSGSGAAVSSGSSVQGEVGAAGPDSNHVPPQYRGIVEAYFSDRDGS